MHDNDMANEANRIRYSTAKIKIKYNHIRYYCKKNVKRKIKAKGIN